MKDFNIAARIRGKPSVDLFISTEAKPLSVGLEALLSAILFLAILGVYSLSWFQGVGASVSTIGAERVLRGEIPYRDFWTMYAPGHFYLLALLFRIFGSHILVETVAASVVCAAAAVVCYWLVLNLVNRRVAAIACAGIFVAATYNTEYFKSLGTYPPTILFVLVAQNLMVLYYKSENVAHLIAAGVATGAAVVFKHDVGGYTAIAILAGLLAHAFVLPSVTAGLARRLSGRLAFYCVGVTVIALPIYIFFAIVAGKDLLQDLIIFPLTDFRFSRPEHYPGFFELSIYGKSFLKAVAELFRYFRFALPFALFLCGLVAVGVAVKRRKPMYAALGVTFAVAYLLHYAAAHVQINTHIISMSVYGAFAGVICFDLLERELGFRRLIKILGVALAGSWLLSLLAEPADKAWAEWKRPTAELELEKVKGQKVSPNLVSFLSELLPFIDAELSPNDNVFVGLHRHDAVIVGANAGLYFMLDRPIATRYHEIHPAVVDTAEIQREIIRDLQDKNVSLIILKRVFSDEALEKVKQDFLRNLLHIGATDLDKFIQANYVQVREIGNHTIWKRKDTVVPITG
jgi:hypothetical protein